jgi:glycine cleavage system H lipoate-binding protein
MANVFRIEGVSIPESADTFLGIHSEDQSKALAIPDFMTAIQNNPNAIGLCRLSDVMGPDRRSLIDGIVLLPFDRNNNGQLDYHEQIYGTVENFLRGVWIGKYPNQLVTNIYFVSETQPQDAGIKEFLSWIITEGQPYLMTNGVTELTASERLSKLEKINQALNLPNKSEVKQAGGKSIIIIAGLFAFVCVLFLLFVYRRNRSGKKYAGISAHLKTINENVLTMPNGLYFDKSHTWVYLEKNGLAKVGIDDFLLHITGSFSRVKMKEPGSKIKKGEAVLTLIQNGKQINLHSPVSGTIREINDVLVTNPEVIHESPYDLGWIYMVEPSNWLREIQFFNLASTYRDWVKSEFIRLKDFLAASLNSRSSSVPILSLQEGGELKCHILRDLGPEIWEEFQSNFIDNQNN